MRKVKSMVKKRILKNVKGVSPTISSMLMIVVTVVAMLLVISFSQTMINTSHAQMAERLFIEKVCFTDTYVDIYVRNIGTIDLKTWESPLKQHARLYLQDKRA